MATSRRAARFYPPLSLSSSHRTWTRPALAKPSFHAFTQLQTRNHHHTASQQPFTPCSSAKTLSQMDRHNKSAAPNFPSDLDPLPCLLPKTCLAPLPSPATPWTSPSHMPTSEEELSRIRWGTTGTAAGPPRVRPAFGVALPVFSTRSNLPPQHCRQAGLRCHVVSNGPVSCACK